MPVEKLLGRLHLPETDPEGLHRALENAICLAACSVGAGSMSTLEPLFLSRARKSLQAYSLSILYMPLTHQRFSRILSPTSIEYRTTCGLV